MAELANARITLSLNQLAFSAAGLVVVAGGVLWAVLSFTMGGLQNDVAAIRASVDGLQKTDTDTIKSAAITEIGLRKELGDLTAQLKATTGTSRGLSGSIKELDGSIQSIDAKLTSSIERQASFERYVIASLTQLSNPSLSPAFGKIWGDEGGFVFQKMLAAADGNPINTWRALVEKIK